MLKKFWFAVGVCVLFCLSSQSSFARKPGAHKPIAQVQAFACDFDDNLFITFAKIYVWDTVHKREEAISTANWALVRQKLGKVGRWKRFVLRKNGLREFDDNGPYGDELFKRQIEEALRLKGEKAFGPSWPAFVYALSHPETRKWTTIITARHHSPNAILKGLQVLVDRGYLPALPFERNVFSVGWAGLPKRFQAKDTSESKAKVMVYQHDRIERVKIPRNATPVWSRNGTKLEKLNLWGFSDDDFGNVSAAIDALGPKVAAGKWAHEKDSIFFTGLNNPDQKPHAVVVRSDGKTRKPRKEEAVRMRLPHQICGHLLVQNGRVKRK